MTAGCHTVHVRISDAATGRPTPVRVRFADPEGTYYAPFGRQAEFARGWNEDVGGNLYLERWAADAAGKRQIDARKYAFIDGTCEISLPAGTVRVEVHKGPEYLPLCEEILLPPGKLAMRLEVRRWADLRAGGWYSGDARCHLLTPHAALLEAAAEDVAVVNLLAQEVDLAGYRCDPIAGRSKRAYYPAVPNLLAFSGQRPALEAPGHMVVVNTHNYHGRAGDMPGCGGLPSILGELSLLNCHRVVYPLRFGSYYRRVGGRLHGWENWTLADWCDQCHRKGGLVVWSNVGWQHDVDRKCGEALADLILGKVDAFEVSPHSSAATIDSWYKLLNCGFQVPLVGASGKDSNDCPLGFVRTYARLRDGEPFTYGNWIEAVRAGRTFVTAGPLLDFTVNGQGPGSVVHLTAPGSVHVHAEARSLEAFEWLGLVVNGELRDTARPSGSPATAVLDRDVDFRDSGWLAVRCQGWERFVLLSPSLEAHASPVYVRLEGRPPRADPEAVAGLVAHLDHMLDWVREYGRFENDQQRERLAGIFQSARQELLSRPTG